MHLIVDDELAILKCLYLGGQEEYTAMRVQTLGHTGDEFSVTVFAIRKTSISCGRVPTRSKRRTYRSLSGSDKLFKLLA